MHTLLGFDPDPVRAALAAAVTYAGSQQKLARACGVSQPSISKALASGRLSARLALGVHRATAGLVPASVLRPDLWTHPAHVPEEPPWAA
jgi:DNA-binding transcriptional regulator YdaS (Cro superfamily)